MARSKTNSSRISLCMIVRDSSRTLGAALESAAPWVDEIICVDTGSLDDTRDVARRFNAKIFEFPWCDDFAAARNESLRHASGDWLFWMDSDDTLPAECGKQLRKLAREPLDAAPLAYVMQVHCPGPAKTHDVTVVDHVKVFRNDLRLRFEGRIHEQILPAIRRAGGEVRWTDAYVVHSGAEHTPEARRRKQERDLRLLEIDLAERPDHPFVLFNFGMTYADMERFEDAASYLERCLAASSPDESHVRKAYALLAGALVDLGRYAEAEDVLERGLALYADDAELSFRKGIVCQHLEEFSEAIAAYQRALANDAPRHFSSRDRGVTGHKARHNLALVYSHIFRPDLAELQWRLALDEQPANPTYWRGLVEVLLEQRKYATLRIEIERAARSAALVSEETALATARLAAAEGDVPRALDVLADASREWPRHLGLLRLKCQLLFESGLDHDALVALETLCRLDPSDGASWHNLGAIYQKTGCTAQAVTCYQKSLAVRPDAVHTLLQLGYAQHAADRTSAARRAWEKARQLAPNDPSVLSAWALLGEPALAPA